jgi:ribonuclease E
VSRRIEGEDREELKEALDQLEYPKGMSLIARTAGIGRSAEELQWDLNYMLKLWDAIEGASKAGKGAFLIYQESSLVIRAIRDYFTADIGEILIDTDDIFDQAQQFMNHVMPETAHRVKRYRDDAPLFSRFQIEHQIETAFSRTVNLPSGGAIVIDHTEALVAVDVNSARATRGGDIEETATRTNLEAADEIARQMRLRDLGGLIVVDFIDMEESKNRRDVEQRLRDGLRQDRARVQFSSISKFGLLELSRQRLRPALSEGNHITCPRCNGTGHIRDTESSALQILRMVQEEAMKDNTAAVHVQVPVEVTSFLLNEKRTEITKIELKQRVTVLLVPNKHLETPNYKLERLRHDDPRLEGLQASYTMVEEPDDEVGITRRKSGEERGKPKQQPIIKGVLPDQPAPPAPAPAPAPVPAPAPAPMAAAPAPAPVVVAPPAPQPQPLPAGGGFFGWVKRVLGGAPAPAPAPAPAAAAPAAAAATAAASVAAAGAAAAGTGEARRDGRRGERGDRGERGERGEGRRGGRGERGGRDRGERGGERGDRADRAPRREQEPRAEGRGGADAAAPSRRGQGRPDRPDRAAPPAAPAVDPATAVQADASAQPDFVDTIPNTDPVLGAAPAREGDGGRRRRRGGRGRDRGEARPEAAAAPDGDVSTPLVAADGGTAPAPRVAEPDDAFADTVPPEAAQPAEGEAREGGSRRRRGGRGRGRRDGAEGAAVPQADGPAEAAEAVETAPQPQAAEPAQRTPVALAEPQPAPREAPAVAAEPAPRPVAAAPVQPFVLPVQALQSLAEQAGLQWVGSDAEKIRLVQQAIAAEPKPQRVPREPRPVVVEDFGPLVLVETKKALSQLKLPFDQQPPPQ